MHRWLLVLLTVVVVGCGSPMAPTVPFGRDFTIAEGESVEVVNTNARIKFVGVADDSRCPADAVCIQGGDATVKIDVNSKGAHTEHYEFHTGHPQPVSHAGFVIVMVSLMPYPFSSGPVRPNDYRVTLRVGS